MSAASTWRKSFTSSRNRISRCFEAAPASAANRSASAPLSRLGMRRSPRYCRRWRQRWLPAAPWSSSRAKSRPSARISFRHGPTAAREFRIVAVVAAGKRYGNRLSYVEPSTNFCGIVRHRTCHRRSRPSSCDKRLKSRSHLRASMDVGTHQASSRPILAPGSVYGYPALLHRTRSQNQGVTVSLKRTRSTYGEERAIRLR